MKEEVNKEERKSEERNKNHCPRKRFGQHFLNDFIVIEKIISSILPHKNDLMAEIGPGLGALTKKLLPLLNKLHVIEIDREIPEKLRENCKGKGGELIIHCEDVLQFNFSSLIEEEEKSRDNKLGNKIRVIGNLPYNISTPLLFYLFSNISLFEDMHFMLQKEVADRITAKAGASNYGRLSVMVQYYCQAEHLFIVSKEAFTPKPKVTSAVLRLKPYEVLPYKAKNKTNFEKIVKQAFMQRRKTLRNNLKELISQEELAQLDIDFSMRPQQIGVKEYVRIENYLTEALAEGE